MIHVPSLKIYCVKEVPINSRENRSMLKRLVNDWGQNNKDE